MVLRLLDERGSFAYILSTRLSDSFLSPFFEGLGCLY